MPSINCNCESMRVCYHRSKIEEAWSVVTPVADFARWRELTAQLESTCEYRAPNTKEDLQNDTQQLKDSIAFIKETFKLANKEPSAAHAMVVVKNRFDVLIAQLESI